MARGVRTLEDLFPLRHHVHHKTGHVSIFIQPKWSRATDGTRIPMLKSKRTSSTNGGYACSKNPCNRQALLRLSPIKSIPISSHRPLMCARKLKFIRWHPLPPLECSFRTYAYPLYLYRDHSQSSADLCSGSRLRCSPAELQCVPGIARLARVERATTVSGTSPRFKKSRRGCSIGGSLRK